MNILFPQLLYEFFERKRMSHISYCLHMPSFQLCYTEKIFSEGCEINCSFFFSLLLMVVFSIQLTTKITNSKTVLQKISFWRNNFQCIFLGVPARATILFGVITCKPQMLQSHLRNIPWMLIKLKYLVFDQLTRLIKEQY